jgi:predicted transcriptional regulator
MIRKEIRRFLDSVFDGSADSLVSHLAEMKELSLSDLREIEQQLRQDDRRRKKGA